MSENFLRRPPCIRPWRAAALAIAAAATLAACGQKGPLYLPDKPGEVVTRPAQTPPPVPDSRPESQPANSPQSVDSPQAPANPAPEVTAPEATPVPQDERDKQRKNGTPPKP